MSGFGARDPTRLFTCTFSYLWPRREYTHLHVQSVVQAGVVNREFVDCEIVVDMLFFFLKVERTCFGDFFIIENCFIKINKFICDLVVFIV